jgi:hypothetical protein
LNIVTEESNDYFINFLADAKDHYFATSLLGPEKVLINLLPHKKVLIISSLFTGSPKSVNKLIFHYTSLLITESTDTVM